MLTDTGSSNAPLWLAIGHIRLYIISTPVSLRPSYRRDLSGTYINAPHPLNNPTVPPNNPPGRGSFNRTRTTRSSGFHRFFCSYFSSRSKALAGGRVVVRMHGIVYPIYYLYPLVHCLFIIWFQHLLVFF